MDNPRQNIEICVITEAGVKPLAADELDRIVHEASIDRECYPSPLNYYQVGLKFEGVLNLKKVSTMYFFKKVFEAYQIRTRKVGVFV